MAERINVQAAFRERCPYSSLIASGISSRRSRGRRQANEGQRILDAREYLCTRSNETVGSYALRLVNGTRYRSNVAVQLDGTVRRDECTTALARFDDDGQRG